MKMLKGFICIFCAVLVLVMTSACNSISSNFSQLAKLDNIGKYTFLEEKQELLKLPNVTEDPDGNVIIPLKANEKIEITLPSGNIIKYKMNSGKREVKNNNKTISICKEYKYKIDHTYATVEVDTTVDCDWDKNSVTINRSYQDISGCNPSGNIIISNKQNTIVKQTGDSAIAEASGNIEYTFLRDTNNYSEIISYRQQMIVDATTSQSAIIKILY